MNRIPSSPKPLGKPCSAAVGTSGAVYPAAGYVEMARSLGIRRVEINLDPSDNAYAFDDRRYGPATAEVPRFVAELLG